MREMIISNKALGEQVVMLDDDDYERLKDFRWSLFKHPNRPNIYVKRHPKIDGKYQTVYMHREITNGAGDKDVDHIDGNSLNNQKANLRICEKVQNCYNKRKAKNNTTGFKGVYVAKKRFQAFIGVNHRLVYLGSFKYKEDAARAYNTAAIKHFGQFARLNEGV